MYKRLHVGEMVKGLVVALDNTEAIVDLGTTLTGYVPIEGLTRDYSKKPADIVGVGDELELIVLNINDAEGTALLRLASLDSQREELKRQNKQTQSLIVNDVLSQVQENLSAMKPGLISEIAISVYSQLETKMMNENMALKTRVNELEKRLLQLERIIDKLRN